MTSTRLSAALAAIILCAASQPALAQTVKISEMTLGYTYFNRQGADTMAHDKAVGLCALQASKTQSVDQLVQPNMGLLGAMIGGALSDAYNRSTAASALENCMVVGGWRVVRLPDAEGKALAALDQGALSTKLSAWIGQAQPYGEVTRVWGNDLVDPANDRFVTRPAKTVGGQLSLKAVSPDVVITPPLAPAPLTAPTKMDAVWPKKPIKPADLAKTPPDGAVVLLHVRNVSLKNGIAVLLNRMGPDLATLPSVTDKGPDAIMAAVGLLFAKKEGNMVALVVPAGRWRISGLGLLPTVSTCLGAPGFDVKAGEVMFAGSFDMAALRTGPDMDLGVAKAWLGAQPAADLVKPAEWINGLEGVCGGSAIYALEFEGAPFEAGYQAGSRAVANPPGPATPPA